MVWAAGTRPTRVWWVFQSQLPSSPPTKQCIFCSSLPWGIQIFLQSTTPSHLPSSRTIRLNQPLECAPISLFKNYFVILTFSSCLLVILASLPSEGKTLCAFHENIRGHKSCPGRSFLIHKCKVFRKILLSKFHDSSGIMNIALLFVKLSEYHFVGQVLLTQKISLRVVPPLPPNPARLSAVLSADGPGSPEDSLLLASSLAETDWLEYSESLLSGVSLVKLSPSRG